LKRGGGGGGGGGVAKLEKPLRRGSDKDGNVTAGKSKGFNIREVEQELIETAKKIVKDYEGRILAYRR